jgi:hypothetical protein
MVSLPRPLGHSNFIEAGTVPLIDHVVDERPERREGKADDDDHDILATG